MLLKQWRGAKKQLHKTSKAVNPLDLGAPRYYIVVRKGTVYESDNLADAMAKYQAHPSQHKALWDRMVWLIKSDGWGAYFKPGATPRS